MIARWRGKRILRDTPQVPLSDLEWWRTSQVLPRDTEIVVPDALVLGEDNAVSYHLVRGPHPGARLTTTFVGYRREEVERFLARLREYNVIYRIIQDVVQ